MNKYKRLRLNRLHLTQAEMARRLKISQAFLSRIESGLLEPNLTYLRGIKKLKVDVNKYL